jgi:SSS family solute:Na+ symporter
VTCFVVTLLVSLATQPRDPDELRGLVYSLTPRLTDRALPPLERPWVLATVVLVLTLVLNLAFF